jgi:hypothetical protein
MLTGGGETTFEEPAGVRGDGVRGDGVRVDGQPLAAPHCQRLALVGVPVISTTA